MEVTNWRKFLILLVLATRIGWPTAAHNRHATTQVTRLVAPPPQPASEPATSPLPSSSPKAGRESAWPSPPSAPLRSRPHWQTPCSQAPSPSPRANGQARQQGWAIPFTAAARPLTAWLPTSSSQPPPSPSRPVSPEEHAPPLTANTQADRHTGVEGSAAFPGWTCQTGRSREGEGAGMRGWQR